MARERQNIRPGGRIIHRPHVAHIGQDRAPGSLDIGDLGDNPRPLEGLDRGEAMKSVGELFDLNRGPLPLERVAPEFRHVRIS